MRRIDEAATRLWKKIAQDIGADGRDWLSVA